MQLPWQSPWLGLGLALTSIIGNCRLTLKACAVPGTQQLNSLGCEFRRRFTHTGDSGCSWNEASYRRPCSGWKAHSCIVPISRRYKSCNHNCIRFIGELMLCEFCGGETKKKSVKRQHWLNKKLYIVEDVNAEVCTECGERYFHAKTLDAIDDYLSKKHTVKAHINVEIVSFSQAVA